MKPIILSLAVAAIIVLHGCHNRPSTPDSSQQKAEAQPAAAAITVQQTRQRQGSATAEVQFLVDHGVTVQPVPGYEPPNRENYDHFTDNALQLVAEQPVSTFAIDVDTASYSNVRRLIMRQGLLPPPNAVRVEEMVNYFNYDYAAPADTDTPFSVTTGVAPSPWNPGRHIMQIGLRGYASPEAARAAANLVFLVDVSGSMHAADKLPLVKRSLRLLVNRMTADDRIALVTYANDASIVLESTAGDAKRAILTAVDQLEADGGTNGGAGLQLAYELAADNLIEGGINRVIIASDGDLNIGIVDQNELKAFIAARRKSGIALTTLGFGSGNYNYALMEQLADVGDGNAAYIDSLAEAQKVLVNEIGSTLETIARDVKIQVEFNPAVVAEYRLVGYENRLLQRADFTNDKVDAGDIGAGHRVTALYELALVTDSGRAIAERRYGNQAADNADDAATLTDEMAYIRIRSKHPDGGSSREQSRAVLVSQITPLAELAADTKFALAVAGFGQLLRGGQYLQGFEWDDVLQLARQGRGDDAAGYRGEFIRIVELAQSLQPLGLTQ